MSDKRRLIYSILEFLSREIAETSSEDGKESLEVGSQCLETAFGISIEDDKHLAVGENLEDIFKNATRNEKVRKASTPCPEDKERAESLKMEGNELLRNDKVEEAISKYTEAIALDGGNQVFYCNRAAAYSKMNNAIAAIDDCRRALDMNPNYSKAYGRMGLAYASLDKHSSAIEAFKKALELEPENESYKTNLAMAQEKSATSGGGPGSAFASAFGSGPLGGLMSGGTGPGGMDLGSLLSNPALMNMATSMLSDPNMQSMMGQFMSGNLQGSASGMDGLLQAGQRLAEQMQQSNPDLVEQLRRQVQGDNPSSTPKEDTESKKE